MELVYRDAVALIEALDLGAVHFCGLSMGGFLAMRLGARRPDLIRSLVLMNMVARAEHAERIRKYRIFNILFRGFGHRPATNRIMPILIGRSVLADPARAVGHAGAMAAGRQPTFGMARRQRGHRAARCRG
jgi:pimeloyl-ACP methyl ester carboxylesterase